MVKKVYSSNPEKRVKLMIRKKIVLNEEEIPKQWYCILPDLPKPMPPFIETETRAPGAGIVPKIFPKEIIDIFHFGQLTLDFFRAGHRRWLLALLFVRHGFSSFLAAV